jgi:hypothetical protein
VTETVTLIAEVDGQQFGVELHRVTGWDAIAYRAEVGSSLDALIAAWLELVKAADGKLTTDAWPLADRAVLAWLWYRQNPSRDISLAAVASKVTLIPDPAGDEPAGPDAPGAD